MAMTTDRIEKLIEREQWQAAQRAIEQELKTEPDDHWLWSRLSAVKYEQHDYQGALVAADKALEIVPDCPLALWSRAGALDMLGRPKEAGKIYAGLIRRGVGELTHPDEDAEECWEGVAWTRAIVMDSLFRVARCLETTGKPAKAVELYQQFLLLLDYGMDQGLYSREDALKKLKELQPAEKMMERAKKLAEVMG